MNSTRAGHALLGTLLVVALSATACSESKTQATDAKAAKSATAPASDVPAKHVIHIEGYPATRTFDAMVRRPGVDTIVVISGASPGKAEFTGPDTPNDGWDAPGDFITTPIDATVSRVFRGTVQAGDPIRMTVSGGRIGEYEAIASTEVAPLLDDLAKYDRLVIAGETVSTKEFGQTINPWFVYGIDADEVATNLLDSAGPADTDFPMTQLQDTNLPTFKPLPAQSVTSSDEG